MLPHAYLKAISLTAILYLHRGLWDDLHKYNFTTSQLTQTKLVGWYCGAVNTQPKIWPLIACVSPTLHRYWQHLLCQSL